jgi:hypothetical protein
MKKETKSHILFLTCIVAVFFLGSCVTYYVPNVINTPLFSEAGETSLAVHKGISGTDPQFAVAITDNLALMVNGSYANRTYKKPSGYNEGKYHKHQFVEAAAGYFNTTKNNMVIEGFVGMGKGKTKGCGQIWELGLLFVNYESVDSKYTKYFFQPSLGKSRGDIEVSGSARFVMVTFDDREIGKCYYMEPVATVKYGSTWLKVFFQTGISLQLNFGNNFKEYNPYLLSFGLEAKPGIKRKSKNNSMAAKLRHLQ